MYKKDIKIGDILYWNTSGAYKTPISLICRVVDKGEFIWVHVFGNLSYNNLKASQLSLEPLYKVTNSRYF